MRRYGCANKREACRNRDWRRSERSEGGSSIPPHKRDKPSWLREFPFLFRLIAERRQNNLAHPSGQNRKHLCH